MDRRRFLGAAAATGLAGFAGCSTTVGTVAKPKVPQGQLDDGGWEQIADEHSTVLDREFSGVSVTAKAHTVTYEKAALRREIEEKTLGQVSGQFALFSATRVDMAPPLDEIPGVKDRVLDTTEENAREQFRGQMRDAGLENVEQVDTGTLTVDTGEEARLTTYEAEFPMPSIEFPVTENQTITIEGGAVEVLGDLVVWHNGEYVLVAGGAHPVQNVERDIDQELSEAIDVSVSIDLGLTPDAYQEELRGLITATE
jgi:hypothetical protein